MQCDDTALRERSLDGLLVSAGLTERHGAERQAGYDNQSACHRNLPFNAARQCTLAARSGPGHFPLTFPPFHFVHRCEASSQVGTTDLLVDQLLVKWRAACLGLLA